jgi:hypothetical protein
MPKIPHLLHKDLKKNSHRNVIFPPNGEFHPNLATLDKYTPLLPPVHPPAAAKLRVLQLEQQQQQNLYQGSNKTGRTTKGLRSAVGD